MTSAISANLDPEKHGIRTGEISLLMATRGRPEMLAEQMLSPARSHRPKRQDPALDLCGRR